MTLEEQLVGYLEISTKCTNTVVLPPPPNCPVIVDAMYQIAQWHLFTAFLVIIFLGMIAHMTYRVIFPSAHH